MKRIVPNKVYIFKKDWKGVLPDDYAKKGDRVIFKGHSLYARFDVIDKEGFPVRLILMNFKEPFKYLKEASDERKDFL